MKQKPDLRSLVFLLLAQTQVAFNDNVAKLAFAALAYLVLEKESAALVTNLLAGLLVLPFILFAPLVGWISDTHSKQRVLNAALILQILVMLVLAGALLVHSMVGAVIGFALLAIQSSLFSPAKQGILKELIGEEKLGVAVGWMEMLAITAILMGGVVGGTLLDWGVRHWGDPWKGGMTVVGLLSVLSVGAWIMIFGVQKTPVQSNAPFRTSLFWEHFVQIRELWSEKHLRLAALGNAYFWGLGGVLYLTMIQLGREIHANGIGAASDSGIMLAVLGLGVCVGSLLAAALCRRWVELGLVPVGGFGLAIGMFIVGLSDPKSVPFYSGLLLTGVFGGLFCIPLTAYLQNQAGDERRGQVIATANLWTNLFGIGAVALQYLLGGVFQMNASSQCLLLVVPSLMVAGYVVYLLPESFLRLIILTLTRLVYRVHVVGQENLPKGGALFICNHISYVDAIILSAASPRPIRFVAFEAFHKIWWCGWLLKVMRVIPISPKHAKDAIRQVANELKAGEWVCVFPEGELTRTGNLLGLRKGFELMARQGKAPVVPVHLDALWGSIFSFFGERYIWKFPQRWPYPVRVSFGKMISQDEMDAMAARQAMLDENEKAFQLRPELKGNLARACVETLSRKPGREMVVDLFPKRQSYSRGVVLALAILMSKKWSSLTKSRRIGIILPPGIGGTVANLAVVLMGKVPVNLNFTAGRNALASCIQRADIDLMITALALKSKFPDIPWPEKTVDIAAELKGLGKGSILKWLGLIHLLPGSVIAGMLGISTEGDHQEAGLLFTSGSSGEPKGVVLSHRNLLGNVAQINAMGLLRQDDTLLACLPLFHSFGFTVTLWYPLVQGARMVCVPSPLEVKKIAESIREEKATVLMGTPTFIRPYLKRADPGDLKTLRFVITGAEKLPQDLAKAFQDKFGVSVLEGYGLTETSPVASVNLPDPPIPTSTATVQVANRPGTVGRLIPGMTTRIVDPETGAEKSLLETGMLWLKGPNIFEGYLGDTERTNQVIKDRWFVTGDLARYDEDGFLIIEGRLSRFSKIGGEMVPHGTVEQKIIELFGLEGAERQPLMVTGIPDAAKGEALVMLTTVDVTQEALRDKLGSAGLPNLWIPKTIKKVDQLPTLASGKLDLKGCENLARAEV